MMMLRGNKSSAITQTENSECCFQKCGSVCFLLSCDYSVSFGCSTSVTENVYFYLQNSSVINDVFFGEMTFPHFYQMLIFDFTAITQVKTNISELYCSRFQTGHCYSACDTFT